MSLMAIALMRSFSIFSIKEITLNSPVAHIVLFNQIVQIP